MELPAHELNLWAEVFRQEYLASHPDEKEEMDCIEKDIMPSQAFAMLGGDVKGGK
jgi:hypothetical protein